MDPMIINAANHKLLSRAEEQALFRTLQIGRHAEVQWQQMDKAAVPTETAQAIQTLINEGHDAKKAVVKANVRLVLKVVSDYTHKPGNATIPDDDLVQEGFVGLLKAIEGFDPSRGFKFSTYAVPWIRQAISTMIAERTSPIRVPVGARGTMRAITAMRDNLRMTTAQEPTDAEVAEAMHMTKAKVALYRRAARPVGSLDTTRTFQRSNADFIDPLVDRLPGNSPDVADEIVQHETATIIRQAMQELTHREQVILTLRFGLGGKPKRTLKAVGELLHISRQRVEQLQQEALEKLAQQTTVAALR